MSLDLRRSPRRAVNDCFSEVDAVLREYASDLSQSGVFIRTQELLPVGTRVQLRFTVVLDDFETIEGEGRVVRAVGEAPGPGLGIEFDSLTDASQEALARYCRRQAGDPS